MELSDKREILPLRSAHMLWEEGNDCIIGCSTEWHIGFIHPCRLHSWIEGKEGTPRKMCMERIKGHERA